MQTRTHFRNWTVAAAVAAMMAASSAAVLAQDAVAPAPMAPDSTASAPMAPVPVVETIDYSILKSPFYNYMDLKSAKTRGLSDSQIATIAKIAKETDQPFNSISAAVERGETFSSLATEYGLRLSDVYDSDKEKSEIENYKIAYESLNNKGPFAGEMSKPMEGSEPSPEPPMVASTPMSSEPMPTIPPSTSATPTLDIVETAMAAKNLTTLVKALQIAGLVETLKGAGPFTVFAPDDKAFSKLPAGELDSLLADPVKLKTILTYHVIPASIDAATAMSMSTPTSPPTVEGATLQVTRGRHGRLMINDADVIKGNIYATNGIIHIINKVLLPPADVTAPVAPGDSSAPAPVVMPVPPAAPSN